MESGARNLLTPRSVGTQVRPHPFRVLGKRPNPRADELPESQRPRNLETEVGLLSICQEEEGPVPDPESLLAEMEAQEELDVFVAEVACGAPAEQETSGISTGKLPVDSKPPDPFADIESMIGNCEGVRDARTGQALDPEAVRAGRRTELHSMRNFKVWELIRSSQKGPGKVVKVKWVHDARPGGVVRARLVAMEIAYDVRSDTFAGTPGLVVVR